LYVLKLYVTAVP